MGVQVSIVIPVYRVQEPLLRKCIESCILQNNDSIEIILVDDCSPDSCGAVCDELASRDSRVRVIHKSQNEGLSAARNTGVEIATGEWLTFLDGDDWLENDTCDLVNRVSDPRVELIIFGSIREYEKGSEVFSMPYTDGHIFEGMECKQLQIDVLDYSKRLSTAYGKFTRLSFLKENQLFHDSAVRCGIEGIEYSLRLFGFVKKAIYFDEYKYHYVYNLQSITGAPSDSTNQFVLLGIEKMEEYIRTVGDNSSLYEQFEKRVQRVITDTAIGCYYNPNYLISNSERRQKLSMFCSNPVIAKVMQKPYLERSTSRRGIYFCTKHHFYFVLKILGWLRLQVLGKK